MKIKDDVWARQAFLNSATPFNRLALIDDLEFRSAAMNMAVDEAMMDIATIPIVRFYRWNHPAISFGYFGRFANVEEFAPQHDLVRRWTGGGIVFHGDDLTYSIVIPANDPRFADSSMAIYEKVHRALAKVLNGSGQAAAMAPRRDALPGVRDRQNHVAPGNLGSCFANPVEADVMLHGKKVAGAAQRRAKRGLLHQGSIQSISLEHGFEMNFAKALSENVIPREMGENVVDRAQQIASGRYATEAWLHKR